MQGVPNLNSNESESRARRQCAAETFVRNLHPCAKIACILAYVLSVVSLGKYDFADLLPYLALPVLGAALLNVSSADILLKSLPAIFLAAAAGCANVFLDSKTCLEIFSIPLSFGLISLFCLILKAYLCVGGAIVLTRGSTPNDIAYALGKFGLPCVVSLQLMFTARYLDTLASEALRISRAYSLRSPNHPKIRFSHFPHILLSLLLRSVDRANRIYKAMRCRGFSPRNYKLRAIPFKLKDAAFLALFATGSLALRLFNPFNFAGEIFR